MFSFSVYSETRAKDGMAKDYIIVAVSCDGQQTILYINFADAFYLEFNNKKRVSMRWEARSVIGMRGQLMLHLKQQLTAHTISHHDAKQRVNIRCAFVM